MNLIKLRISAFMIFLSFIVGILAGMGAILLRGLVAFFHNLFFLRQLSFVYDENMHTQLSVWGLGVIFVPVLGGLIVIWIIEKFAKDEKGLSVPEVMYKLRNQDGKIQPRIALAKTLASAISIGSGASIGREGPVVQIGAAISSLMGDVININVEQRKTLVAVGVAAGTAAIFNAPLAGIAFAIELFLISINTFTIILLFLSAITATLIENLVMGSGPLFQIQAVYHFNGYLKLAFHFTVFTCLGIILGAFATLLIRGVYWAEDLLKSLLKNVYLRHMVSMFFIGVMLYLFISIFGHYYIGGIGFSTIQDCLNLVIANPWLLLLLAVCKLLATCLSLGSGASGGIFSPALFIGATLGTFFGLSFNYFFPTFAISPVLFTLAGMAGMTGSVTGAVITAILLIFEMTNNLYSILPALITAITSYAVRLHLCKESIYTLKLTRRGITLA